MVQKKRFLAGILGCLLAIAQTTGSIAQTTQQTQTNSQETNADLQSDFTADTALPVSPEDLQPDYDDPDYVKHLMQEEDHAQTQDDTTQFSLRSSSTKKTVSPFTGLTYTHAARLSNRNIVNGIDVSKWQAAIDWKKVKNAGVEFVFIRCGYTSLSSKFAMYEDPYFKQNIEGAYNAGIKVGIYFFSNSITTSEAKKEAQKTLELIDAYKNKITMPVVYDFEAFSNSYRAYGLTKAQITKNALTYLKLIQTAGYTPMYYSSPSYVPKQFDLDQLEEYDFWLANYTTQTSYDGDFVYWQYSSTGKVDGISGNADCNFFYTNSFQPSEPTEPDEPTDPSEPTEPDEEKLEAVTGLKMSDNSTSSIKIKWNKVQGADGYEIYRSSALGGTYKQIQVVSGGAITSHLDTKVAESEGRQYYYKVTPFTTSDGAIKYGAQSDILIANTERIYKYRLKTKTYMNLREQAGTEYASIAVVPEGTVLTYNRFTLSTSGNKWYKVTYKKNGISYVGYLSGSYVKRYTCGTATKKANIYKGAGTTFKLKSVVKKGTDLTIMSTTSSAGVSWSHVSFKQNKKECKGYIKTKFIQRC